jgi:hypothetical protein
MLTTSAVSSRSVKLTDTTKLIDIAFERNIENKFLVWKSFYHVTVANLVVIFYIHIL